MFDEVYIGYLEWNLSENEVFSRSTKVSNFISLVHALATQEFSLQT